jgi:hypothetical protein
VPLVVLVVQLVVVQPTLMELQVRTVTELHLALVVLRNLQLVVQLVVVMVVFQVVVVVVITGLSMMLVMADVAKYLSITPK